MPGIDAELVQKLGRFSAAGNLAHRQLMTTNPFTGQRGEDHISNPAVPVMIQDAADAQQQRFVPDDLDRRAKTLSSCRHAME